MKRTKWPTWNACRNPCRAAATISQPTKGARNCWLSAWKRFAKFARRSGDSLSPLAKEFTQHLCGLFFHHSRRHFHLVIEARMIQYFEHRSSRSSFRILGTAHKPRQPRMDHRSRAHRARLQRHVELAAGQAIVVECLCRGSHGDNLRMSRGLQIAQNPVLPAPDDLAFVNHNRANRHLAGSAGRMRLGEGFTHKFKIAHVYAGCCCVMQCSAPSPQMKSPQCIPTTLRSGNTRARVLSASRSLGSLNVGTS